jgi:hypothetical protein
MKTIGNKHIQYSNLAQKHNLNYAQMSGQKHNSFSKSGIDMKRAYNQGGNGI